MVGDEVLGAALRVEDLRGEVVVDVVRVGVAGLDGGLGLLEEDGEVEAQLRYGEVLSLPPPRGPEHAERSRARCRHIGLYSPTSFDILSPRPARRAGGLGRTQP